MTTQFVSSGVVSSGVVVSNGNILEVLSGGTADVTSVTGGGIEQIDAGGVASGTVISAGGSETVLSGGTDLNTIISNGGFELVSSGGTISSTTIAGGTLELAAGAPSGSGTITFATVVSSQTLKIDGTSMPSNPIASFGNDPFDTIDLTGATFASGGSATLLSGGVVQIVENGHTYDLNFTQIPNGLAYVLSPDGSGGTDLTVSTSWIVVSSGNTLSGFVVSSGISLDVGGTTINTVLSSGGREYIESGGADSGTVIAGIAYETVFSGGTITSPSYSPKIARSRGPGRDFARAAWPVDRVKR
jgi:autotransporter passenger strand-loop-strand repeat protein